MIDSAKKWTAADSNILGLITGICLIILPFPGSWWSVQFGDGAFAMEFSPFTLGMYGFGKEFFSPLITAVNTAIIIIFVFFGAFLLIGSVLRCSRQYRQLSDQLVGITAGKPIWLVVFYNLIVISVFGIEYSLRETGVSISLPVIAGDTMGSIASSGTIHRGNSGFPLSECSLRICCCVLHYCPLCLNISEKAVLWQSRGCFLPDTDEHEVPEQA